MPFKVVWIAFLVTMVYWLGNAVGCASTGAEQNYKVLEEDEPLFQTTPHPDQPGATQAAPPADDTASAETPIGEGMTLLEPADNENPQGQALPAAETEVEAEVQPAPSLDTPPADINELAEPVLARNALADDQPSLAGLDRTHWPRIEVTPASGAIRHGKLLFEDLRRDVPEESIRDDQTLEEQIDAALADTSAQPLHGDNLSGLVLQPLKFGLDLALLPVKVFLPGRTQTP